MNEPKPALTFWVTVLAAPGLIAALTVIIELAFLLISLGAYHGSQAGLSAAMPLLQERWNDVAAIAPGMIARQFLAGTVIGAPLHLCAALLAVKISALRAAPALFAATVLQVRNMVAVAYGLPTGAGVDRALRSLRAAPSFIHLRPG